MIIMSELSFNIEFWIVGVAISMVSVVGLMGNILCILMFKYKRLNINKTFASLLSWLAVIDSYFLVSIGSLNHYKQYVRYGRN